MRVHSLVDLATAGLLLALQPSVHAGVLESTDSRPLAGWLWLAGAIVLLRIARLRRRR